MFNADQEDLPVLCRAQNVLSTWQDPNRDDIIERIKSFCFLRRTWIRLLVW